MIEALIAGQRDPRALAELPRVVKRRGKAKALVASPARTPADRCATGRLLGAGRTTGQRGGPCSRRYGR
jgi:hypothetical protein